MRFLVVWMLLGGFVASPLCAQEDAPPDSLLPTGTPARFWSVRGGWDEGFLARWLLDGGGRCLTVFSPTISGAVSLKGMDSLLIDTSRANVAAGTSSPGAARVEPPRWRALSVPALRRRESGCD